MNHQLNDPHPLWSYLIAVSAPTRQVEVVPPFGFTARFLAEQRIQQRKRQVEALSFRAVLLALGTFCAVGLITVGVLLYREATADPTSELVAPLQINLTQIDPINPAGGTDV